MDLYAKLKEVLERLDKLAERLEILEKVADALIERIQNLEAANAPVEDTIVVEPFTDADLDHVEPVSTAKTLPSFEDGV